MWLLVDSTDSISTRLCETDELEHHLKLFSLRIGEIIMQSRSGKRVMTKCSPHSLTSDYFGLDIPNFPQEVREDIKTNYHDSKGNDFFSAVIFCIDIYLQTYEGPYMRLETWLLSYKEFKTDLKADMSSVYIRMQTILKSLLTMSRQTPGYFLSRRQGPETYKIGYRIYKHRPSFEELSKDNVRMLIGTLSSPIGELELTLYYRPKSSIGPDQFTKIQQTESEKTESLLVNQPAFSTFVTPKNRDNQPIPFEILENFRERLVASEREALLSESYVKIESVIDSRGSVLASPDLIPLKCKCALGSGSDPLGKFYDMVKQTPELAHCKNDEKLQDQIGDIAKILDDFEAQFQEYDKFSKSIIKSNE